MSLHLALVIECLERQNTFICSLCFIKVLVIEDVLSLLNTSYISVSVFLNT